MCFQLASNHAICRFCCGGKGFCGAWRLQSGTKRRYLHGLLHLPATKPCILGAIYASKWPQNNVNTINTSVFSLSERAFGCWRFQVFITLSNLTYLSSPHVAIISHTQYLVLCLNFDPLEKASVGQGGPWPFAGLRLIPCHLSFTPSSLKLKGSILWAEYQEFGFGSVDTVKGEKLHTDITR